MIQFLIDKKTHPFTQGKSAAIHNRFLMPLLSSAVPGSNSFFISILQMPEQFSVFFNRLTA